MQKVAAAEVDSTEAVDRLIEEAFLTREKPLEDVDGTHFENIARFLGQRVVAHLETVELYHHILRGDDERDSPSPPVHALKLSGLVKTDRNVRLVIRNEIYRRRFDADWATIVVTLGDRSTEPRRGAEDARLGIGPESPSLQGKPIAEHVHKESGWSREEMRSRPAKLFISHSSLDDAFVRELRWTLADLKQEVWIDSRELRGGDPLWPGIQKAIEESSAVAVVVSPNSLQAKWVGKELRHALDVQQQRGRDQFPVFVLSLDGTKLGVLEELFGHEPLYIPVSSAAGGVEAAMNPILVAMGKRLPAEVAVPPQPTAEPLEELVLELTDLKFHEENGVRRPSARARLVYEPSTPGQREVASAELAAHRSHRSHRSRGTELVSRALRHLAEPLLPRPRRKVEDNLVKWGRLLHDAALPAAHTANVVSAWSKISDHAGRRFSVSRGCGAGSRNPGR